jgi:archaellum biogenesis ATPase FlaH
MSNDNDAGRPITPVDATGPNASLMANHTADLRASSLGTATSDARNDQPAETAVRPYTSPLHRYSLRGQGAQLEEEAVAKLPLLGDVCMTGDVTLWGAPPNSGKTLFAIGLLADAVMKRAMQAERAFYLNLDDSMSGVAEKVTILQDYGVHVLAEGYRDFSSGKVASLLDAMIADGSARDSFVIVDTLKKIVDPMDKRKTVEFMKLARRFVLAGGSILLLAHTNKQRGGNGKLILAGVADLQDDCDTAYLLDRQVKGDVQQVVFDNIKRRGGGASRSVYTCSGAPDVSYVDRLLSMRYAGTDPEFDETVPDAKVADDAIVETIELAVYHGNVKKMVLVDFVRMVTKAPRQQVKDVLDAHTGPDPAVHLWNYVVKAKGAKVFQLHHPLGERAAA